MVYFRRGTVVSCKGRISMVWLDTRVGLVLLPIQSGSAEPHDVAIDDPLACGVAMQGAVVRSKREPPVSRNAHHQIGAASPVLMCRVVQALVRREADEMTIGRWMRRRPKYKRDAEIQETSR